MNAYFKHSQEYKEGTCSKRSYFNEELPCDLVTRFPSSCRDTIKPQQINLPRGTLPNLNFHGRRLRVKLSAFPGVNLLTSRRGDTELSVAPLFYHIKF